jgi:Flp pilus assembly protein TadD/TolB-like protein
VSLAPGTRLGPYEIIAQIGAGGMGEVYRGRDTRLDRIVAIKVLPERHAADSQFRDRFDREARTISQLDHPHICAIYDVGQERDTLYLVMQHLDGETLAHRLNRSSLPISDALEIAVQMADALAAAHAAGIVHRDLKPGNIMLTKAGAKLLDFGLAKMGGTATGANVSGLPTTPPITEQGAILGTFQYAAPEQLIGREADARSDVYSLGIVLFEMTTGRRPYEESGAAALAVAIAKTRAPSARDVAPAVPSALSAVIARAIESDPGRRYQSAAELRSTLVSSGGSDASVARRWSKPALAAALVMLAAFGVWQAMGNRRPASSDVAPVLAILPVDNPTRDPQTEHLAVSFAAMVAENVGSVPGLTAVSRSATAAYEHKRNDLDGLARDVGARYVLDLAVTRPVPDFALTARLRQLGGAAPMWERTLTGDPLGMEKTLLDGVAGALDRAAAWPKPLGPDDWKRLRQVQTTSGRALLSYSQARALMDRYDLAANVDAAIALLNQAVVDDPQFVLARAALAEALWEKYQSAPDPGVATKATDAVTQAVRLAPQHAAVLYALASRQYMTGRADEAAGSLKRALASHPDDDKAHQLLGRVLADRGDVSGAVTSITEAIRLRPQYWRHYNVLGLVLYRASRYREALQAYRRATELEPLAAGPFQMLGTIHYRLGEVADAVGNFEHAARLGPNPAAFANLGLAYYNRNRLGEARDAYRQSLKLAPKSIGNWRNLGDVYTRLRETSNARRAYERAIAVGEELLAVNAQDFRTIALVALCEAKLGRTAAAERHIAEARALAPTDREALQRSAEVHARLGDTDAAMRDLRAAFDQGYDKREARENDELAALKSLLAFQQLTAAATEVPQLDGEIQRN